MNNPLSLADESPWQQYFYDRELRNMINQDVERTFPELEYFQSHGVRGMMQDVLFVYARENPHVAYKQGMHEILGPLLFVLFFDQQAYQHACEVEPDGFGSDGIKESLEVLTDGAYLEDDAFAMLTQIMRIIQPWYYSPEAKERECGAGPDDPFPRLQDSGPTNALMRKLSWINDTLLQGIDPALHAHLEKLEIANQIYGIRWLRLLFGREFPIQDLLCVWDAIFADGPPFVLVDHIFVAMLVFIRDLLLGCDYTGCLHYLMRYPPVADVHSLMRLALHFRFPHRYAMPPLSSGNYSHITVSGRPHPNTLSDHTVVPSPASSSPSRFGLRSSLRSAHSPTPKWMETGRILTDKLQKIGREEFHYRPSASHRVPQQQQNGGSYRVVVKPSSLLAQERGAVSLNASPSRTVPHPRHHHVAPAASTVAVQESGTAGPVVRDEKEEERRAQEQELLKEQVSCLQIRLTDVEASGHFAADRIATLADEIDAGLNEMAVNPEHELRNSITALREVTMCLRGSLKTPIDQPVFDKANGTNVPVEIGREAAAVPVHERSQSKNSSGDSNTTRSTDDSLLATYVNIQSPIDISKHLPMENELKEFGNGDV